MRRLAVGIAAVVARLAPLAVMAPSVAVLAADGAASEARELAAASPDAAALVARAERAASDGRAKDAWALFGEGWRLDPRRPRPARGICRLALALGLGTFEQRAAARSVCQNAFMLGGSPEDMHNRAAALVRGAVRPSMEEVVDASLATDGAFRQGAEQPWAYGARADVAWRLGDRALLDDALDDLRRFAPRHAETARVDALAAPRASVAIHLGRLAVLLALLGTAAHALFSSRRRRRAAVLVAALAFGAAWPANASDAPGAARQLEDPLAFANWLTEGNARAQEATKRGDHAAAVREYEDLTKAVPDNAFGFARLCDSLEAAGRSADALVACRTALTRKSTTAGDYTHFVQLVLSEAQGRRLFADERRQVDVAVAALEREPRAAQIATRVRCNVAVHERDVAALDACTAKLVAAAPEDVRTIQFQRALAVERGDSAGARLFAARARAAEDATLARNGDGAGPAARASVATRVTRAGFWAAASLIALFVVVGLSALARRGVALARRRIS